MENTFPPALVEKINGLKVENVTAEVAKPASPRYYRSLDAELNLSAELGGGFFLRWISRLSEALLRRRLEARLQGPLAGGVFSLLQSDRRPMHDAPARS